MVGIHGLNLIFIVHPGMVNIDLHMKIRCFLLHPSCFHFPVCDALSCLGQSYHWGDMHIDTLSNANGVASIYNDDFYGLGNVCKYVQKPKRFCLWFKVSRQASDNREIRGFHRERKCFEEFPELVLIPFPPTLGNSFT